MAMRPSSVVLTKAQDILLSQAFQHLPEAGENEKSCGWSIEKKIELLESSAGKVSNRRARRWLNDRLLMELVPRLNGEEIRGLFAPPPWGDDVPLSPFCMTNVGEWDKFRNIDMDKQANKNCINRTNEKGCNKDGMIKALKGSSSKRKSHVDTDKIAVLNAWHRVNCRTREALRRSFLSELIEGYEIRARHMGDPARFELALLCSSPYFVFPFWQELPAYGWKTLNKPDCLRSFIKDGGDVLVLHVQDPFRRLLLHGVCEFYNLVSLTATQTNNGEPFKTTQIRKKKTGSVELPKITLSHFLKMSKEGIW